MKAALIALTLAAFVGSTCIAAEPLRVFLFTKEVSSGSVDEQLAGRQESLRDLTKALSDPKYQQTLTIVHSRNGADVIVELVSRGETTTTGSSSSMRSSGGTTASASQAASAVRQFLKLRISAGQLTREVTTESGRTLTWPQMAVRAAADLTNWISANVSPR